ncbi:MAG: hypothetical protein JNM98_16355 [Rhodocyclaceae bacterium]|nr:hypothetical protein [Rhodocyclaceae bacterium]
MFKKLFGAFGKGGDAAKPHGVFHEPYADAQVNFLYNLLFCDNLELFRRGERQADPTWSALLAERADFRRCKKLLPIPVRRGACVRWPLTACVQQALPCRRKSCSV